MQPPIGVSGLGVVSAFGTTHAAFVSALLEGRSAVAPIVGFDTEGCRTRIAAQASCFEPTEWISPMKLRRLERTGVYAVALTRLAFEDGERTPQPDGASVRRGSRHMDSGGQSTQQYWRALAAAANAPALLLKAPSGTRGQPVGHGVQAGANATVSHKEASVAAIVAGVELCGPGVS